MVRTNVALKNFKKNQLYSFIEITNIKNKICININIMLVKMNTYNSMIQALKDLKIPNCTKEKHFDNLLFCKFFNNSDYIELICG